MVHVDQSLGGLARIGYQIDEHFAVEVAVDYAHGFDVEHAAQPSAGREVSGWAATGNVKVYPLGGGKRSKARPFVAAGYGSMELETDPDDPSAATTRESERTWRFGAGVEAEIEDGWALVGEGAYLMPEDDLEGFAFWSLSAGFLHRF